MPLLPKIQHPEDIKQFSLTELSTLAEEIRHAIIDVMAINGGHLGSNLGTVELIIALHYVFNSPQDKLIFDVSHQSYPHKMLTGRYPQFSTIRQYKGLAGFANPEESIHDHFFAGHAGTALSLALGVAKARDLSHEDAHVIPIIGDATLTCGLALEALNNISKTLNRFLIILNDNQMSISDNVGAITEILDSHKVAAFFEQFGIQYVGDIDGHDIPSLISLFEKVKNQKSPLLLHISTVKGKGLCVAEENPIKWHGCSAFDKVTGLNVKSAQKPTFPKIFGQHLLKMADRDPSILAVTPAMPLGSCITPFMEKYPDRCIDVGIAEGHAVTFSGGIASNRSLKVVCSIYSTFLQRAFDNLFQDVCLQKSPVLFALDRSGIATGDGVTHHGIYDIAFLNAMPNMVICQPRNGQLLKELLESAFSWQRPTTIRYPNLPTEEGTDPLQMRPLGKGEILEVGTGDIALIALGHMCTHAYTIRDLLAQEGLSVTIVDPIFVKPLDTELLVDLFMSHRCIVTLEEHAVNSGLGTIINSFAIQNGFNATPIFNFGVPDTFIHQGTHNEMLTSIGLDAQTVAREIVRKYAEETAIL